MARPLRSQKKQTRLQFQNLPTTSDSKEQYSAAVQGRLANVRYSGAKVPDATPENHDFSSLPTPKPSSATRGRTSSPLSSSSPSPSLPPQHTPSRPNVSLDEDDEDDEEDDIPLPSSKRRKLATAVESTTIASSPRRSTRLVVSSPLQSATAAKRANLPSTETGKAWSDIGSPETSGDDADEIITKPTGRRRGRPAVQEDDPFVVDDNQATYISSDDEIPVKTPRKAPRGGVDGFMVDDDEIEYESNNDEGHAELSSRPKRRLSNKKLLRRSRREQEEIAEDLLDLQDSDHLDDDRLSRTRGGPVTTKRDETRAHLARLREKRAGKRSPRRIVSENEDDEDTGSSFSTDGVDIDHITRDSAFDRHEFDESSQSPALIGAPEPHPENFDNNVQDDDEDDFIVQDTDPATSSRHNRPNPDIPLQFTSFASAKPKELFIHVIEWMVKNKISPAFSRDDDLYDLSFTRIDDQVKAQAGSRLISAAWNATFKYAILARPTMAVHALPGLDEDNIRTCDACNRTNHPARYDFTFTGTPYHKDNLEPLDPDDEDEEDSASSANENDLSTDNGSTTASASAKDTQSRRSQGSYDSQGHLLPLQSTHFYLGRYCAAAAEMGHKLTHWKHHLNTNVLSHLSEQGVLTSDEILRRDKKSHKKREKEAENIVDAMQDTGVIRELWDTFQADLEDARYGMEGHEHKPGKARGSQRIGSVRAGAIG